MGWREWLRERYAKYWYVICVLFLDIIVAGFLLQGESRPAWRYAIVVAFVVASGYLAVLLYRRLWPQKKEFVL